MSEIIISEIKTFFKKSLFFLKDYLALIILIPTIVGGLWQFFELMDIGYPFLRFFSISQMVPDGILMLFMLPTTFLISLPAFFIYTRFNDFIKSKLLVNVLLISLFLITVFVNFLFLREYFHVGQILVKPSRIDKFIIFSYFLFSYLFVIRFKIKKNSKNKFKNYFSPFWNAFSVFWGVFLLLIFIVSFIRVVNIVGYKSSVSDKMINNQYLNNHLEQEYDLEYGFFHVAYFNDKYIFVKYHPENDFHVFRPISNDYFYGVLVIKNQDGFFPENGFKVEY